MTLLHLGGDAYAHPDLDRLITTDLDKITPHPDNPRNGDTDAIVASIRTSGMYRPVFVQRATGRILAGNHTYAAALELGADRLPVVWLDVDDEAALRIMVADNRTADLGTYDEALLAETLHALTKSEAALIGTGYSDDDLGALMEQIAEAEARALDGEESTEGRGALLNVADLSLGEPTHEVHGGQVWRVGKHVLVVVNPHHDWATFLPYLVGDAILAPYPDIYFPMTDIAQTRALVLVQPNRYLAGHLLDKYATVYPDAVVASIT